MKYKSETYKIIKAGLASDMPQILGYTNLLISKLEEDGDTKFANRLKNMIKKNKTLTIKENTHPHFQKHPPVDGESRLPLAEISYNQSEEIFLSLPPNLSEDIEEYIQLISHSDELIEEGVRSHKNLLLYGPPGTGKTRTATYISSQTKLPLVTVRIDGLVSSYLGSTSKNIRTLFDYVKKIPCILFLDEFDAIAKMRDDSNELGELKRVVNSLLQNIDSLRDEIPVIAATNHHHLLDQAVWRRFDYKLYFNLPSYNEREAMIKWFLKSHHISDDMIEILAHLTGGFSGSEIENMCDKILTYRILNKKEMDLPTVFSLFSKYSQRDAQTNFQNQGDMNYLYLKKLRERNKKIFTIRTLSKMSGFSVGKIHGILKE